MRLLLTMCAATLALAAVSGLTWQHETRTTAQALAAQVIAPAEQGTDERPATPEAARLIEAAEAQVGVTRRYDPSYQRLAFPGGDVAPGVGVCTDVLIRAMRRAYGIDLQVAIHRDMTAHFSAYPALWGLAAPDANIDHRRVPNLEALLRRLGAEITVNSDPDPPPLKWSAVMFRETEDRNGYEETQTRRDCHEAAAG